MRRNWDATDCLESMIVSQTVASIWHIAGHIPAKSGHDENSNEYDTKESRGTPASLGADFGIAIGFALDEM